jgi:hypothetical protein
MPSTSANCRSRLEPHVSARAVALDPKLAVAHSDLVLVLERRRRRADRRVSASGATTKMTQSWMINRAVRLGSLTRSRQV